MPGTHAPGHIDALLSVWRLLQSTRLVTLSVRDVGAGRLQARGTGSVAVETVGGSVLVVRERGRWTDPRGGGAHFTDALRWTLDTDMGVLRLEHLRQGADAPVTLLELAPEGDGRLEALAPHVCGEDRYEGSLRVVDGEVEVSWRVTGPKKDLEIRRLYA